MKTLFANNEKFDAFVIDVLTMTELALVKGGGGDGDKDDTEDPVYNWPL